MALLSPDDARWRIYRGGYNRVVVDLAAFLNKLESAQLLESDWSVLWDELHHQGDVGEASYAVVPYLAAYAERAHSIPWHVFAFPVVVELCRDKTSNPEVPDEVKESYESALKELPRIALARGAKYWDSLCFEPVMASLALSLGRRSHASAYLELTESELSEFFKYYYEN